MATALKIQKMRGGGTKISEVRAPKPPPKDSIKFSFRLKGGGSSSGSATMSEPVAMALYQILMFGIGSAPKGDTSLRAEAKPEAKAFEAAAQEMFEKAEAWLKAER